MENYQMSRPGCRPYIRTCGMSCQGKREMQGNPDRMARPYRNPHSQTASAVSGSGSMCNTPPATKDCNCKMPGTTGMNTEMLSHLQYLEPAMAYVPCQEFTTTFDLPYALSVGTIFPQLCKPFCGKRGRRP